MIFSIYYISPHSHNRHWVSFTLKDTHTPLLTLLSGPHTWPDCRSTDVRSSPAGRRPGRFWCSSENNPGLGRSGSVGRGQGGQVRGHLSIVMKSWGKSGVVRPSPLDTVKICTIVSGANSSNKTALSPPVLSPMIAIRRSQLTSYSSR